MELDKLIAQNEDVHALFRMVENYGKEQCSCEYIRPKAALLRSMDVADHIHYLVYGEMWAFNEFPNGRRYSTERIVAHSFIGEMEIIAHYPKYISTVTAVSLCLLVRIPEEVYRKWFQMYPEFARAVAGRLAGSLCRNSTTIGINNLLSARESVSILLCNLYRERQKDEGVVAISETRQGLADQAGVSLRSVNRVIASLVQEGTVALRRGKVVVSARSYSKLLESISNIREAHS